MVVKEVRLFSLPAFLAPFPPFFLIVVNKRIFLSQVPVEIERVVVKEVERHVPVEVEKVIEKVVERVVEKEVPITVQVDNPNV